MLSFTAYFRSYIFNKNNVYILFFFKTSYLQPLQQAPSTEV